MSIFIIMLALLCFCGIKFNLKDGFEDYMSPKKSGAIKGIFTIIVLLSHVRQFATVDASPFNDLYKEVVTFLGQLMVVMFLFYSGYGITLGLKNKNNYAESILTKRFPKVLIHFDIAVLIFFLSDQFVLGNKYNLKTLLISLTGWEAVGNQNWYIFISLVLYLLTFSVFIFCKKKTVLGISIVTVLSAVISVVVAMGKGGDHWWYDTIMCYPLGMWYAIAKPRIDKILLSDFNKWFACTAGTGTLFFFLFYLMEECGRAMIIFIPAALLFTLFITILSMRISIYNSILDWFGKHVFSIYILHNLPMRTLKHFGLNQNEFLFTAACFAITIILAEVFDRLMNKLDKILKLSK